MDRDKHKKLPRNIFSMERNTILGTTYMAACGLEASRRDSMRSNTESEENFSDNVVRVMAQFAAEMMAALDKLNTRYFCTSKPHRYTF